MDTPPSQPWDLGQAVSGILKGVKDFFVGFIMKPFDECGLGHRSESADCEQTENDSVVLSDVTTGRSTGVATAADRHLVVRGGLIKGNGKSKKSKSRRITEKTLGTLSPVGAPACSGSSSSSSSNSSSNVTLDISNSSLSSSVSGEDGRSDDGVIYKGTKSRVTFDHGVDVRTEWHDYLARAGHDGDTGRDRAATMVDGDDFSSLVEAEAASAVRRRTRVQPQRVLSRAACFALMEDDENNDNNGHNKDGRKPIAYGRMKDIVSSCRGGINGNRTESLDDNENDDEDDELTSLFESYDGSLASMQSLKFPPTFRSARLITSRPPKKLFDSSALVSRSRVQWMTPAELDDILSRTKGWKKGTGGSNNGRRGDRRARRKKSTRFDGKLDWGASMRATTCRVSVENVLKDELFGLAIEEHRASLLYKRAFLNWEGRNADL